ncbi:DUF6093 family protein [Actinomadura rugatobispora]|uniref:DUF6093 family protein n=1 Tax=Actinomadura rugatobispora TaxID=1994 RepID=A0ABW0ZNM5_9ACTN|nr:hypothetical protein GCM10010200_036430 [Actinomadura rugatobispora]
MPFPGTHVIPPDWSSHHRPTATSAMTATCVIARATGQGITGPTGIWDPSEATTIYTGPCRVVPRATDEGRHRTSGERQVTPRRYEVTITYDAATIRLGDQVRITAAQDAGLVGLTTRVIDVSYSSEQWQRVLFTQELQEDTT